MKKTVEQKYQSMTERDHILLRPGMWVGSIKDETRECFGYNVDTGKMEYNDYTYVPAMLKLFDEILSNSCDEYRRKDNLGLDTVTVVVDTRDPKNHIISVEDNGGIPVVMHKEAKVYVPEFIFGRLRTSSNYDDTEDRNVIGTNGLGATLTNVFSNKFMVETADKKKKLTVEWTKNMAEKSKPEITTPLKAKSHYTKILFSLDFSRFDQKVKGITDNFISILHKRCIDAAAANLGLTVNFYLITSLIVQETKWKFKSFEDYMDLYSDYFDKDNVISYEDKDKQVWLCPDCLVDMTFVNGAECSRGTHIKAVKQYVAKAVSEFVKKKNKIDVTAKGIDGKYGIFGSFEVSNPAYSSQTKEELTVPVESFYKDGHKFEFPDKFQQKILKSEIVSLVLDWYAKKQEAEDLAKVRKMNKDAKKLLRSDKFIDCNSKKRTERTLIIFEGDSAGAAFRTCRNPVTQAAYFMRGVPKSVYGCTMTEIMKNQVFNDIVNIIGLQWGTYNDKNDLRFSKIIIGSDMDPDGSHIAGLLLLFFNCFPELFEQHMICRLISPFIIASKGKPGTKSFTVQYFNSMEEYRKAEKKLNGYEVKHVKGLGTLNKEESKEMYRNPIYQYFTKDQLADLMFKKWFDDGKEGANTRKDMMKDTVMSEGSLF